MTSACMLIRTEKGKYQEVVDRLKQIPSVRSAYPVLGRYDIVADIESTDGKELGNAILKVNRLAGVIFTETMPEVEYS
jgi:DNA-binding Lrp family transcriptional regulator